MRVIKDFIHNRSDVIVVLIILIAAGLLIHNRINVILDYPEKLAEQNAKAQAEQMAEEAAESDDQTEDKSDSEDN